MSIGKRHHFRPQSHLKLFAGPDGRVWTYGIDGDSYPATTKNIGVEGQLYQTDATSVADPHKLVEKWITEVVDTPIAPILLRMSRGDSALESDDVAKIAIYFAAQDMRTPFVRDQLALNAEYRTAVRGMSIVEATIADYEREHGPLPEALRQEAMQIAEPSVKNAWLQMMMKRTIGVAAAIYDNSQFVMFKAPKGAPWISNDWGIVKFGDSFDRPIPFVTGLRDSQRWFLAVSPEFAVTFEPKLQRTQHKMTPFAARRINAQMVQDAEMQIYSRDKAQWIVDLLAKRK